MFGTLKLADSTDELLSIELTDPPFEKKRRGKLAQTACVLCRASKLKCSGEPSGCQRCVAKAAPCCYPKPAHWRFKRAKESAPQHPVPQSDSPNQPTTAAVTPRHPGLDPSPLHQVDTRGGMELTMSELLDDANRDLPGFDADHDLWSNLSAEGFLVSPPSYPTHSGSITTGATQVSDDSTPAFVASSTGSIQTPSALSESPLAGYECSCLCSCLGRVVHTFELVQINFARNVREPADASDDVFQLQKSAITECEGLAGCTFCSHQSAHIMLAISVCDRILFSLEALGAKGMRGLRSYSRVAVGPVSSSLVLGSALGDGRRRSSHTHPSNGTDKAKAYATRSGFGRWLIDDDDQHHILQALLESRLERLDGLLRVLKELAISRNWLAHLDMCQMLQERVQNHRVNTRKT